jgi:hypothetical protein
MSQQQPKCATPQSPGVSQGNAQAEGAEPKADTKRDERGRFAAGNRGGPGNPFARQTAALRVALINAATPERITNIANAILDKAEKGDVPAAKLVFAYTVGKPAAAADPDTLDQQEMKTLANNHVDYDDMERVAKLLPVRLVLELFQAILPYLNASKAKKWADMWQDLGAQMDQERAEEEAEERAEQEADADVEDGSEQAPPQTLEESVRAWDAEVKELKAKLSAEVESTAPAKETVAQQRSKPKKHQQRRRPKRQPEEARETVAARGPGRSGLPSTIYRPSRNGSNGAAAGAKKRRPDR